MSYFDVHSNFFKWLINLKKDLLKAKSLEYILIIAVTITIVFGFAEFLIDPNIHSFADGMWYTWVTMTHVGYGDVVPTSFIGRLLGTMIILFGLGLFAIFAASFSATLIGKDLGDVRKEMHMVEKETHDLEREESRVLQELARLHQRIDQLEAKLTGHREKGE
jgi:voltage-gated potassium channel